MPHRRTVRHQTSKSEQKPAQADPAVERDEANKHRFVDQTGIEARDLPGGGRDNVETDPHKEAKRNMPQQHGGEIEGVTYAEGGMRGDRDMSDADDHGGRKHN